MALSNPKLLQTLVPLLLFSALFLVMLPNKVHSQDTTTFSYYSFNPPPNDLIFQSSANVTSDSTLLHLTATNSSGYPSRTSIGRVVYSNPVHFWAREPARQASFETNIYFTITSVNDDPADGIAFFISAVNATSPPNSAGGNFGLYNSSGTANSTFAVEFDTYVNGAWDPNYRHVGININSRRSRSDTEFEHALGQEVHARIDYEATTRRITVDVTYGSRHVTLNDTFNLESILPEWVQVGITASTGVQVAHHDVRAWEFTSTLVWENEYDNREMDKGSYIRQYV